MAKAGTAAAKKTPKPSTSKAKGGDREGPGKKLKDGGSPRKQGAPATSSTAAAAAPAIGSAEYSAALAVLCPDTMSRACALLLSTSDFDLPEDEGGGASGAASGGTKPNGGKKGVGGEGGGGPSDAQKLLSLVKRVAKAADVIKRAEDAAERKAAAAGGGKQGGSEGGGHHLHAHHAHHHHHHGHHGAGGHHHHHHGHHHPHGAAGGGPSPGGQSAQIVTPKTRRPVLTASGRARTLGAPPSAPGRLAGASRGDLRASLPAGGPLGLSPRAPTAAVQRSVSGSSVGSGASATSGSDRGGGGGDSGGGGGRAAKRQRVSPPPAGGGDAPAPPPSAMNFLAALNAQKSPKTPGSDGRKISPRTVAKRTKSPAAGGGGGVGLPPPPLASASSSSAEPKSPLSPAGGRRASRAASSAAGAGRGGRKTPPPPQPTLTYAGAATPGGRPTRHTLQPRSASTRRSLRGAASASASAASPDDDRSAALFDVGDDVLVKWKDGKLYSAIIRNVDIVEAVGNGGGAGVKMMYTVEFDDGEVCEDVPAEKIRHAEEEH